MTEANRKRAAASRAAAKEAESEASRIHVKNLQRLKESTGAATVHGLDHDTDRAALGRAVLEGVAFAFADAQDALLSAGTSVDVVSVIGGGARSTLWGKILASVLDRPLLYRAGGEVGPAQGAARLARLAVTGEDAADFCHAPPVVFEATPDPVLRDHYAPRWARFRDLYPRLRGAFR